MDRATRTLRFSVLLAAGLALGTACADDEGIERTDALEDRMEERVAPGAPYDRYEEGRTGMTDPTLDRPGLADRPGSPGAVPDVAAPGLAGAPAASGFEDHRREVSVMAVEIEDTTLLVPSAIFVAEGTRSLRVRNDATTDRDFLIEGLPTQQTTRIPAGQAAIVQLDGLQPGSLYSVVLSEASDALAPGLESPTTGAAPATPGTMAGSEAPGATGGTVDVEPVHATLVVLPGRAGPRTSLVP